MNFIRANSTFTLVEWLSITGMAQSVLILVYILFRVRNWREASLAIGYFLVLASAFSLQFARRIEEYEQYLQLAQWIGWSLSPPLCTLLVLQVARGVPPALRQLWVLALVPLCLLAGFILRDGVKICGAEVHVCPGLFQWLYWLCSITGAVALLSLWAHKDLFGELWRMKGGKERYWLVIMLIIANLGVVTINSLRSANELAGSDADALLIALGLAFVYLASTVMFRVYPAPVQLNVAPRPTLEDLTPEEKQMAERIKKLMELDKLYQEPSFSRAALAREINTSESILSKVINAAFGKSFPQLLSEFRIKDAQQMLLNKEIPIQTVASESGFNSLASFNRVFREIVGSTPSQYRSKNG